eukprot:15367418-Alexandrium_andersonii.AAC.1
MGAEHRAGPAGPENESAPSPPPQRVWASGFGDAFRVGRCCAVDSPMLIMGLASARGVTIGSQPSHSGAR